MENDGSMTTATPSSRMCTTSDTLDDDGGWSVVDAVALDAVSMENFKALHAKVLVLVVVPVVVVLDVGRSVTGVPHSSSTSRMSICIVRMVKLTMVTRSFRNCDDIYWVLNDKSLNIYDPSVRDTCCMLV